ncbi:MAG: WYL domain-containing protein, partial [Clostridia bacterium]
FFYFDLDSGNNKKYRHNKQIYTARPLGLVFSGGNYYMAAENKKYATPSVYRVDNMDEITCQGAELCQIDAENAREYVAKISIFDMYGGNIVKVTLCVHNDMERIIRDKFGINVKKTDCDDDHFRISVDVPNTPVFLGWCAMFGNKVKVESPESVVNALKKHIEDSLEQYK